jgi:hypothetical protein
MKNLLLTANLIFVTALAFAQTAPNDNLTSLRGNNGNSYHSRPPAQMMVAYGAAPMASIPTTRAWEKQLYTRVCYR